MFFAFKSFHYFNHLFLNRPCFSPESKNNTRISSLHNLFKGIHQFIERNLCCIDIFFNPSLSICFTAPFEDISIEDIPGCQFMSRFSKLHIFHERPYNFHPRIFYLLHITLLFWEEHFGFDVHQGRCHDQKITGHINIQGPQQIEIFQILLGNSGYRYI